MKEVEFRAWEKNLKEMIEVNDINFKGEVINSNDIWRFFDEIELMQYTGLKDKNGKKIYEGDILLYNNHIKGIVWYKNGAFVRSYKNSNVYLMYDSFITDGCLDDYEVIGNIHENPELLSQNIY